MEEPSKSAKEKQQCEDELSVTTAATTTTTPTTRQEIKLGRNCSATCE